MVRCDFRDAVEQNLWPATEYYNFIGGSGGAGQGYGAPAAVGAALANRDKGIVTVSIEGDGDLMYAPGVALDRGAPQNSAADDRPQ